MAIDFSKYQQKNSNNAAPTSPAQPAASAYNPGNVLAGLNQQAAVERTPTFSAGSCKAAIKEVAMFQSQTKPCHQFLVKFVVTTSISGVGQPGEERVWIQSVDFGGKNRPMQLGAIKAFLYAAAGAKSAAEKQMIDENSEEIVNEAQKGNALIGDEVVVMATSKPRKENPAESFIIVNFAAA